MNSPQTSVFEKYTKNAEVKSRDEKFILMYHGLIVERHGLDIMAEALSILRNKIPNLEMIVCGYGEYQEKFLEDVRRLNLENVVNFVGEVTIDRIAEIIPQIDLGIIPNKITPFTEINFPTRIFEYVCNKKPALVPSTRGIRDYFKDEELFFFKAGDVNDLCRAILEIYTDTEKVSVVINKSFQIYQNYSWEKQSKELNDIYNSL